MHYFRMMRNGKYNLKTKEEKKKIKRLNKYRVVTPNGYHKVYEPDCPISEKSGYIFEHRYIVYQKMGSLLGVCRKCNKDIDWSTVHIDHINNDKTDNRIENLRPLCRACNVMRGHAIGTKSNIYSNILTINGISKSAREWSVQDGVSVRLETILRRKKAGYSDYYAVFGKKRTHHNTNPKKVVFTKWESS